MQDVKHNDYDVKADDDESESGYCALDKPEYTAKVRWIRRGFQKRVRDYLVMMTMMTLTMATIREGLPEQALSKSPPP